MTRMSACAWLAMVAAVAAAQEQPALPAGEPELARAIAAVYPALVQIEVLSVQHQAGQERKYEASGSGAIISAEGHVVTNHHVAGRVAAIRCILPDHEEIPATLVGSDPLADIAVVKLDLSKRPPGAPPLAIAHFGKSAPLKVGDPVLAMGCPLALSQSVTRGIVANKDMMIPRAMRRYGGFELDGEDVGSVVKWIGHDAQIFPGNSGGPLVDLAGEIVGVNEIGFGLSGAIPAEVAQAVAEELIAHGTVRRSWLGASFQPLLERDAHRADAAGVLVGGIVPDSPAAQAGLAAGDLLVAVDGKPVTVRVEAELPAFTLMMMSKPVGAAIRLRVRRGDAEQELTATSVVRDEAQSREIESKEWGLTVRRLTVMDAKQLKRADQRGVLVGSIRPGGPANAAVPDIRGGDVIVAIDGKPVEDLAAFTATTLAKTTDAKAPVATTVAFERDGEQLLAEVEVGIRRTPDPPAAPKKCWLPVATQVLSTRLATAIGLKGRKGVRITEVFPGGSAEQAGLRVGDVLTKIDDQAIDAQAPQDQEVFAAMLRQYQPGATATLTGFRDGKPLSLQVTLAPAPADEGELKSYDDPVLEFKARDIAYLDRIRHRWPQDQAGALVTQVDSGGWASVAGLKGDDIVLRVDGAAIKDVAELEAKLKPIVQAHAGHAVLFVQRDVQTRFIEIDAAPPMAPAADPFHAR